LFHALLLSAPAWAWLGFHVLVAAFLALDLGVLNRVPREPGVKEAALWSGAWIALALAFNGLVLAFMGPARAGEYLAGYLLEKALSVDNLFVFVLVFTSFQVPRRNQHRVLYWGVLGALLMRGAMILAGSALLHRFEWMTYVFGAFLLYTGVRMLALREEAPKDPREGKVAALFRRLVPFDPQGGYEHFLAHRDGRLRATPMLLVLVVVELTDLAFAVDSVPAVLAVTRNPFIVYTSNVFAILGLRSLYFLLAKMMDRFHLLAYGLAAILVLVGLKMCLARVVEVPIALSLAVIALILAGCAVASLLRPLPEKGRS
jgi:tellurite resistance protein TerC